MYIETAYLNQPGATCWLGKLDETEEADVKICNSSH